MEECIIPEALFFSEVDGLKDPEHFFRVEKADQGCPESFLRDTDDSIGHFPVIGIHEADHFDEGFYGVEAEVTGFGEIVPLLFKVLKECDDQFG
jgi:hypothetical protein